jgi:uncharacterized protein YbjT (DUF2867 family)
MYAIMGATGQVGGAAAAALLRQGQRVRAVVRDAGRALSLLPGLAEVATADVGHIDSLAAAFAGTRGVFVLNPPRVTPHDVLADARAVSAAIAEAVWRARVPHVVALSSQGAHLAEGTGIVRTLHDFEAALRATGVPVTFIRAGNFMENWADGLEPARAEGVLPSLLQPLDARTETVSIRDVGAVVAEALADPVEGERVVNLWGPEAYAPEDAAAILSDLLRRPVQAVAPPRATWETALTGAGLGADYARLLAALHDAINEQRIPFEPGVGELRRGRTTLREALQAVTGGTADRSSPMPASA